MDQQPAAQPQLTRGRRIGARAVLLLASTLISLELLLQAASLFRPDRRSGWDPAASQRILCIGDSHTWGAGMARGESYPGQLQVILDAHEPGMYSVINLGVPGMSTTQLRSRIGVWLSRYEPDTLIVWAGVNDAWNSAELDDRGDGWLTWLDQQLLRTRSYRLLRVRLHDRELERYTAETPEALRWQVDRERDGALTHDARLTVRHAGVVEEITHRGSETEDPARIGPRAAANFEVIARYAKAADVELVFITYPLEQGWFAHANRAIWQTATEYGARLIQSARSLERVAPAEREWRWAMHPGPAIYREIALDVAAAILDGREQPAE